MKKIIIFTGGGSGGHVMPALSLISFLKTQNELGEIELLYIGSQNAIESKLIPKHGIDYLYVKTGKLRRYFSFENMIDVFRLLIGVTQSLIILMKQKRHRNVLVFSTGGYVAVPVCIAAKVLNIDIFTHEQTSRGGLANKIIGRIAKKIFITFQSSQDFFDKNKVIHSGLPLRSEFFLKKHDSSFLKKLEIENSDKRPVLFITGGGNGSKLINDEFLKYQDQLQEKYFIIHQVGSLFIDQFRALESDNYKPFSFIEEMSAILKYSDVILSRAGAGTVYELIMLDKVSIFIPLKIAQNNEQYYNALEAQQKIGSLIIEENDLENVDLLEKIDDCLEKNRVLQGKEELQSHCLASEKIYKELVEHFK